MNKLRKLIGCATLCMVVMAQTAFAEQMQIVFYGKTTAYKQISVLALDKNLPGNEIKEQNIKYINQVSSDADGNYSMIFPFDTDGSGYVFRSNEDGMFRKIEDERQTVYVSESGSDLNDGSEGSPFQTLNRALSMAVSGVNTTIILKRNAVIESLPSRASETQLFIETPYRNTALLDALLETLAPDTRLTVAIDVTGQNESIRTLTAAAWKAIPKAMRTLPKLPTVFAFLAKPGNRAPRYAPECAGGKRAHTAPSSKPAVLNNRPKQAFKTHRPEGSPVKTLKGGR